MNATVLAYSSKYSSESNRKKTVGLTVRQDLLSIAREYDINLSKLLENSLIQLLEPQNTVFSLSKGSLFAKEKVLAGPTGIEPVTPGLKVHTFFCRKEAVPRKRIDWLEAREGFLEYLKVEEYEKYSADNYVRYLDKLKPVLSGPQDVLSLFGKVIKAKRHVVYSLRTLFNYYEVLGWPKEYLDVLRNALPKLQSGIDLKVPTEDKILASLENMKKAPLKYQALYSLLLDSGLRLVEAIELINSFKGAEVVNGFHRCEVAMFRGEKQAYYGHFSEGTLKLINQVKGKIIRNSASSYFRHKSMIAPKYLRKFAFDKMIELDVPESIADFIEGRVPKTVGAKHYLALARQSSKFYPRYLEYLERLRQQT